MKLDKAIKSRKSVRKFNQKKKVDWRDIIECVESLRFTPMAGDNFTLKTIIINDKSKIKKISQSAQQDFISESNYVVVICSNPSRTVNLYGKRGEIYARQQAGAAIQNFLLKITEYGLATCWIGHFVEEQVKGLLGIPEDTNIEGIFPIGYEKEKPKTKSMKPDLENFLYFEKYGDKKMNSPKKLNV